MNIQNLIIKDKTLFSQQKNSLKNSQSIKNKNECFNFCNADSTLEYLEQTTHLRNIIQLFIQFKPGKHEAVSIIGQYS